MVQAQVSKVDTWRQLTQQLRVDSIRSTSAAWREPSVRPHNGTRRARSLLPCTPKAQTKALACKGGYVG